MKEVVFLFLVLCIPFSAQSQAIEVIDAIAGTLLPKVTESVKSIVGENVRQKKQEEVNQEVEVAVRNSKKVLIDDLAKEIASIENISSIHSITRRMTIQVGVLDVLSDRNLLASLEDASGVKKQYALQFVENLNDILEDRSKLESVRVTTLNPLLRSDLKEAKEDLDDALGRLKTNLNFTGRSLSFSTDNVDNYISAIDRSAQPIDELRESVEDISRLIESYLESYTGSFNKLKTSIEK